MRPQQTLGIPAPVPSGQAAESSLGGPNPGDRQIREQYGTLSGLIAEARARVRRLGDPSLNPRDREQLQAEVDALLLVAQGWARVHQPLEVRIGGGQRRWG